MIEQARAYLRDLLVVHFAVELEPGVGGSTLHVEISLAVIAFIASIGVLAAVGVWAVLR